MSKTFAAKPQEFAVKLPQALVVSTQTHDRLVGLYLGRVCVRRVCGIPVVHMQQLARVKLLAR